MLIVKETKYNNTDSTAAGAMVMLVSDVSLYFSAQVPGLAVVIVGNRKDSQSYVTMKRKACCELGIRSYDIDLPEEVSEEEVVKKVHELNADPDVHGCSLASRTFNLIDRNALVLKAICILLPRLQFFP